MKIIRFKSSNMGAQMGILDGTKIYEFCGDISNCEPGLFLTDVEQVRLLAPCVPQTIVGAAMNYREPGQVVRMNDEPIFFLKSRNALCGPDAVIHNPFPGLKWWGEPEVSVVIKQRLSSASVDEAETAVFGFTLANDITVENIDDRDHHLPRSKSVNNFCPLGPWIETDLVSRNSMVVGLQNGEVARSGRLRDQIWEWPRILSELSQWMTLEPWDVILTGNPPDFIGGMTTSSPGMRFLEHGDTYTVRHEDLGKLEVTVKSAT